MCLSRHFVSVKVVGLLTKGLKCPSKVCFSVSDFIFDAEIKFLLFLHLNFN